MMDTPQLRTSPTISRRIARVLARSSGAGILIALVAPAVLSGPLVAQKGPLSRVEVVAICEGGDAPTCTNAGAAFVEGRGGPVDLVQGLKINKMGCDAGYRNACAGLDKLAAAEQ